MKNEICLVYPWFGQFNSYFCLWLESATKNAEIDFLIYTELTNINFIKENFSLGSNIKMYETSLEEISNKISNLTGGGKIELKRPYKLCDYKPIYCYIFDETKNYAYWGFGDIDVILGDISNFINPSVLNKYDVIGHAGHMQIMKNNCEINSLIFKTPPDYFKKVLLDTQHNYYFDERNYSRYNLYISERKRPLNDYCADVRPPSRKFGIKYFNFTFRGLEGKAEKSYFYYDRNNGKLYCIYLNNKKIFKYELLYVHLQKRKMKYLIKKKDVDIVIVPNRFIECSNKSNPLLHNHFHFIDFIQCMWIHRKKYIRDFLSLFKRKRYRR